MKTMIFICIFVLISNLSNSEIISEDDLYKIFEKYYFPEKIYFDIDEEKELCSETLKALQNAEIKFDNLKIFSKEKKKAFKFTGKSYFYSRVCYLQNLASNENGALVSTLREKVKYKIMPDRFWNYYKKTFIFHSFPNYLNCYFTILGNSKDLKLKDKHLIKAENEKNFCNNDFCFNIKFIFYLLSEINIKKDRSPMTIRIINIKENAPFSNKRIIEIYGEIL